MNFGFKLYQALVATLKIPLTCLQSQTARNAMLVQKFIGYTPDFARHDYTSVL